MAGYGFDHDWNRRDQSYRNQPMTSSETARGNQSSFIGGRIFRRSRPSNFTGNDKPTSTISTSNTSYGSLRGRDSLSHRSDQGFNYPSDGTTGPLFKGPYSSCHQRNDNFSNNFSVSKSNTSYGMVGDSSHISDGSWSDRATGEVSTRSAGTAVGFYDYPSRSRELPFSHPSQYKNENGLASMSNMSHSMPQDIPTFFSGDSNNMAELSRMPPSFQSSDPYSRHENFPSWSTEFSKSYPSQRDHNNVIDSASMHDTYHMPEDSSPFSSDNYRKMVEYLGMPSKEISNIVKNQQTFLSMPRESPVSQLSQTGIWQTENNHDSSLTDTTNFRTSPRNPSATLKTRYPQNLPHLPEDFRMPHPTSAPMEFLTPHQAPTPREFPMPPNSQTSHFIGKSSSLFLSAKDHLDFSAPNNGRTNFRISSSSAESAGCLPNLSSVNGQFPNTSVFQEDNDYICTVPSSKAPYGTLKDPTAISPKVGQMERESDSELHAFQQLARELRRLGTSKPDRFRINLAASRQGLRVELNTQKIRYGQKTKNSFKCDLFIQGIYVTSGIVYSKVKDARRSAFKAALHKLQMPYLRIIQINPNSKELQASMEPNFTNVPEPSEGPLSNPYFLTNRKLVGQNGSQYKEYSRESFGKKRISGSVALDNFIILAPSNGVSEKNAARTLDLSARLNNRLLEIEYFFDAERVRCVLRIENETLADEIGMNKTIAKGTASLKALMKLRESCWLIKNKQISDSNFRASSKFLTREEFGPLLSPSDSVVSAKFHFKLKRVLENFVYTHTHEELLFDCTFRKQERLLIHQMCRDMGLVSKSTTQSGTKTFIGVKRTIQKLFEHLKVIGGESIRHELFPPGQDVCFQSASTNSYLESAHTLYQSQPEDAYHQMPLVYSGPDSSYGKIPSLTREQVDVGMSTAYKEVSYDYNDDDRTVPPFSSPPNKEIPGSNRRKRRLNTSVSSGSKYFSPSKKPKMNEDKMSALPSTCTPGKSTGFSDREAQLATALKTEKDPLLIPIRRLALSTYGFTRRHKMDFLKTKAEMFNIDVQESVERSQNPKGYKCNILLNNIVVASGPLLTKKSRACKKAYKVAMENIHKPILRLLKQEETNQVFLVPKDELIVYNLSKQSSQDHLKGVEGNKCSPANSSHSQANYNGDHSEYSLQNASPISYGLAQFLKKIVILDTLDAKTSREKLNETALFNGTFIHFVKGKNIMSWDVQFRNQVLATASGKSKEAAKSNACDIALETMRKLCWCVKEKQVHNYKIEKAVSSSDFSMKSKPSGKEMTDLELFLSGYASSNSMEDLIFCDDFPDKARNLILTISRNSKRLTFKQCKLRKRKYLIIGKNKRVRKVSLLNHLKASGGETIRYKITPPTQEPDADINSIIVVEDSTIKSATYRARKNKPVEKTPESNNSVNSVIYGECSDLVAAASSSSSYAGGNIVHSDALKNNEENKKKKMEKGKKKVVKDTIGFDPGFIF